MTDYRPRLSRTIPMVLLIPSYKKVSGVIKKVYPSIEKALEVKNNLFYGNFKTYGGTETTINGVYSIEDTAIIETWYRPDIKSDCRIALADSNIIYDIINEPENINMRNQFLKFKVKRIKGNA